MSLGRPPHLNQRLGETTTAADGSFEFPLPKEFIKKATSRETWGWYLTLQAEHEEYLWSGTVDVEDLENTENVSIAFIPIPESLVATLKQRLEELRTSPMRKHFKYGVDPVGGYGEAGEVFEEFEDAAQRSGSVVKLLRKYETDSDEHLRALAYEALALNWRSMDDLDRPKTEGDGYDARAILDWLVKDVATSKHGGHYAPGIDLDDVCERCFSRWQDASVALADLGREEGDAYIRKWKPSPGQPQIFKSLVVSDYRQFLTPEEVEKEGPKGGKTPDWPLTVGLGDPKGQWIACDKILTMLGAPADGASPAKALFPDWFDLDEPRWSPDGTILAGIGGWSRSAGKDVWILNYKAGTASRVTWGKATHLRPRWFPDGKRLLYAKGADYGYDLWEVEVAGYQTRMRLQVGGYLDGLEFSPDGKRIVYAARFQKDAGLFVAELDDAKLNRLLPQGTGKDPQWSPDGTRIGFIRDQTVVLYDPMTQDSDRFEGKTSKPVAFSWKPDGEGIVVLTNEGEWPSLRDGRVILVPKTDSQTRLLARFDGPVLGVRPSWSPEGNQLAVLADPNSKDVAEVFVVSLGPNPPIRIQGTKGTRSVAWRPKRLR